jgi:hypothetical protein
MEDPVDPLTHFENVLRTYAVSDPELPNLDKLDKVYELVFKNPTGIYFTGEDMPDDDDVFPKDLREAFEKVRNYEDLDKWYRQFYLDVIQLNDNNNNPGPAGGKRKRKSKKTKKSKKSRKAKKTRRHR